MRSGAQKSASIFFNLVQCKIVFNVEHVKDGEHILDKAIGVRATLTKGGVEDAAPKLTLTFAIATRQEDLWWLVSHMGENIKAKIVMRQLELPEMKAKKEKAVKPELLAARLGRSEGS